MKSCFTFTLFCKALLFLLAIFIVSALAQRPHSNILYVIVMVSGLLIVFERIWKGGGYA
jgi:hypothetical protein